MSDAVSELRDTITRLQLVPLDELRSCDALLSTAPDESEFLGVLERRQLLTGFQVEKLKKRDTRGLVLGGYRILYRNAAGSFARVYRGCSIADQTMIGIKVLRERWAKDPDTVQLFRREGEIGRRLKHPNIVPIYDVGFEDGYHFITMEFVEGGNLRDFLKIRGKLNPEEAARYVVNMSDALDYAHTRGVAHRDLKATNVLMSSQGIAKLIDFGLAADDSTLNRIDGPDLQQALEYSTLERGTNAPINDPRSDLFFLGTIFYELVTGQPAYPRTRDRDERKRFGRYRDIRPVTALEPHLPGPVADVIGKLIQTSPAMRYQKAAEVAADLREFLGDSAPQSSISAVSSSSQNSSATTILCVEQRPKHQDVLREYLSSRGYRVLLMSDLDRAVARIKSTPPDALLLMGRSVNEGNPIDQFRNALDAGSQSKLSGVLVLSARQPRHVDEDASPHDRGCVLSEPVPLGIVRRRLEKLLIANGKSVPERPESNS